MPATPRSNIGEDGVEPVANIALGIKKALKIEAAGVYLDGDLCLPQSATGLVIFAHGSGSSRLSSRNRYVASVLNQHRLGTLLFDLLTKEEERIDAYTRHHRFDINLLAERMVATTDWLRTDVALATLKIGYFGASTGAAAALVAAATLPNQVSAVVSRGGRPDLAGSALKRVKAPTLLIVGSRDEAVIQLNERAYEQLSCEKKISIVPGATHLFEEPGTLEKVSELAGNWFESHLI